MTDKYVKYFTVTIKVEGDSDKTVESIGRGIKNWINDTLIEDSVFTDGGGEAIMVCWRENND